MDQRRNQTENQVIWKKVKTKAQQGLSRWFTSKESASQCRSCRRYKFNPWVRNIPWRRKRQPTAVFLSGESHAQRSLAGYSPHGHKESDMTEHTQKHNISNLWNAKKAVLIWKIIEIKAYIKTPGRSQINHLTLHFKELEKEQTKHS